MNPATRAAVAGARRDPRRLLLTGLAVLVATVFAAGSVLLTETLRADLVGAAASTPAGASYVVDPPAGGSADDLAERLRAVPGVTAVAVGHEAVLPVAAGAASGNWLVSSDPMAGPLGTLPAPSVGRPAGPGEVLVGAGTHARTGIGPGDRITVGGRSSAVAGVVDLGDEPLEALVLPAQDAAALAGDLPASRIDVAGEPDRAALTAAAGGQQVRTADEQRAVELAAASASVTSVLAGLSVFAGLALVAAAVVVASTFRIVLARRSRELALLRCVGASRAQVTRSVLAEATLTGLVSGVVGSALAVAGGAAVLAAARASGVDAPELVVPPVGLAGCVLLAVVVTVLAALSPARAAGRTPPVVALRSADAIEAPAPRARVRLPVGAVLVATAVVVAVHAIDVPDSLGPLALTAVSGLLLFAALVVVGPFLVAAAAAAVRPLVARSGPGRLAVGSVRRLSRRTAAMTTVLALGTGLTAALLVGIEGASADTRASIDRNYPADVLVLPVSSEPGPRAAEAGILADRLGGHPELRVRTDGVDVLVDAAPGADPQAVRSAVAAGVGDGAVTVLWAAEIREQTESTLSVARAVGAGLVGVTLVVAVVGVGVTLALSVAERTREIALLRALGLTRSGARRAVALEAGLAGVVAAVLGVLLGTLYGELALRATDLGGGTPPVGQLLALAAGIVLVAVAASWAPMRRAGRVQPAHGVVAA